MTYPTVGATPGSDETPLSTLGSQRDETALMRHHFRDTWLTAFCLCVCVHVSVCMRETERPNLLFATLPVILSPERPTHNSQKSAP